MQQTPPPVTAIIVTYESAAVLAACLQSLASQKVAAIVVDNASQDASVDIARKHGATVVNNTENAGFGRAMNQGVRAASTEFCLLINPDTVIQPDCITEFMRTARNYANWGIIAPEIHEPDGRIFFHPTSTLSRDVSLPALEDNKVDSVHFVSGACMFVKREDFLSFGGFDERIFLFYEDDDLCRRMRDSGKHVLYAPQAKIMHMRGKSVAPSLKNIYTVRFHQAWSRAYVCRKYGLKVEAPKLAFFAILKLIPALLSADKHKIIRQWGSLCGNIAALINRN